VNVGLRVPRDEDAALVARLMNEHWPEPVGEERILQAWTSPRVDRDADARIGRDSYALVEGLGEGRAMLELYGRPSETLLDWAERRAREKGHRSLAGGWSTNDALFRELEERGYRLVRNSHRMEIDLSEQPELPSWPEGIEARAYRTGDEKVLYEMQQEVFEDSWENIAIPYDEWAHWLLQPPMFVPDLWFLALGDGEPAGFAICHPHPDSPDLGWVGILGVRRAWRRRGLGRALLLKAFEEFRSRGLPRAGLGVDAESLTGAHRLYERAGMHVAARYDIYERDLR
jgi:ribosomal protein S18 acetylase RimI-like enzyme